MWQAIDPDTAKRHVLEHISENAIIRHESMVKAFNITTPEHWRAELIKIYMTGTSFTYAVDCYGTWYVKMNTEEYRGI